MPEICIYHYYRSSCSWRVRWALHIKGLKFRLEEVNLLKNEQNNPGYKHHNPSGFVPGLVCGNESFGESVAILEWLEETHPQPPLLPSSPPDRLKVRQLCHTISSGIQPLQNLKVQKYFSREREQQLSWSRHWIEQGLRSYEAISREVAGTFSFGSCLTMADLCLIPQVYNAKRFGVGLQEFPVIQRIFGHCIELKTCRESAPEMYNH